MPTWTPMTDAYAAPNGLVVEPVGSDGELAEIGEDLRNGLMDPRARGMWASQCVRGKRQIFKVLAADGGTVACGELEVVGGRVRPMFVRGKGNVECGPGQPEHDAVSAWLAAVNGRDRSVTMKVAVGQDGFANLPAPELTPWQQVVEIAKQKAISPFMALVTGVPQVPEMDAALDPGADDVEDAAWPVLTGRFVAGNGWSVEPVGSRRGLRDLGEALENMLFYSHGGYAETCASGRAQFAAIRGPEGEIAGCAELRAVAGQIVPVACRARFDAEVTAEAAQVLGDYVAGVNGRRLETNFDVGGDRFHVDGTRADPAAFAQALAHGVHLGGAMPASMRQGGYAGDGLGEDDEYDEDERYGEEGWADDEEAVAADDEFVATFGGGEEAGEPIRWTALSGPFEAPNGFVVEPVSDEDTLKAMGEALHNALSAGHRMWAQRCQQGHSQIVRILDRDGNFVANAELHSYGGLIKPEFNRAEDNRPASDEANAALDAWCDAVNEKRIPLNGSVEPDGFRCEGPAPEGPRLG